ncbi:3-deoxy-D-arabino-heptulosonate 7-phosphate (DAHP) synthase, partial [Yersinia pestis PY-91]
PGSDFRRWVWITIAPFVTPMARVLPMPVLAGKILRRCCASWLEQ